MRLTLRTLLAYMDGVLEPSDAEEIGRKVSESDFASSIVQRTREVVRRIRLEAPRLPHAGGKSLDPNTVAEYLDNTLAAEQVADFEKVCLESDKYLAEVASCHHILTLVLGSPADVPQEARQRMYTIPETSAAREAQQPAAAATSDAAAGPLPRRRKPEVPDYLREAAGNRRWSRVAVSLALLVLLAAVIAMAVAPDWVASLWRDGPPQAARHSPPASTAPPPSGAATPAPSDGASGSQPGRGDTGASDAGAATAGAASPEESGAGVAQPQAVAELPPLEAPPVTPLAPARPPLGAGSADAAPPQPPAAAAVGQLTSHNSVLFRYSAESAAWERVPATGTVFSGDRLVAAPDYRNYLTLTGGITLQLVGETHLVLERPETPDAPPGLHLLAGRAVILAGAQPGTALRVRLVDRQAVVRFTEPGAALAIEVSYFRTAGTDPAREPSQPRADLFVASGAALWDEGPRGQWAIPSAEARHFHPLSVAQPSGQGQPRTAPAWLGSLQLSQLQQMGAEVLERESRAPLPAGGILQSLLELCEHRRFEVRSLACRCLIGLGRFEPAIRALQDGNQRAFWIAQIDALREAAARDPQAAAAIAETLARLRGDTGALLYRMLWGYREDQLLSNGMPLQEARELVERLDHADLDVRVLACWNLQTLTGQVLLPRVALDMTPVERRVEVQRWTRRLDMGQFTIRTP
jgi:hypothetical protein